MLKKIPPLADSTEAKVVASLAKSFAAATTNGEDVFHALLRAARKYGEACDREKDMRSLGLTPADEVTSHRWKCKRCGRDKFTRPCAHTCNGQYRKRGLKWEIIPGAILPVLSLDPQ